MGNIQRNGLLLEAAWEVCNQVGGIYTVLRSKADYMSKDWGDNYCLFGPYFEQSAVGEVEIIGSDDGHPLYQTVEKLRQKGRRIIYGRWTAPGRPRVILFDINSLMHKLGEIKYIIWKDHFIDSPAEHHLVNQVMVFGEMMTEFILEHSQQNSEQKIITHFHEWMAGIPVPKLRKWAGKNVKIVFTTHATILGRYLATNNYAFYRDLPSYNWEHEANKFLIATEAKIERAAAHGAHLLTTVSEVTARECEYLLGRNPDLVLPNGINIKPHTAIHEFQNLHVQYKEKIHEFVMAHFFPSYSFDLDKTLYFFTSGRYEYCNKGFDLTLEALSRLNYRLQQERSDVTVVMFIVTKRPYYSISPRLLHYRALFENIKKTCEEIQKQVGQRLVSETAAMAGPSELPVLNEFVDHHWKSHYRKMLQAWKTHELPTIVTHTLVNKNDEVVTFLSQSGLVNKKEDKVKVVYHPDFINPVGPLNQLEYDQFVRGCHLGIFPSYYEPWGYTPLECLVRGIPAMTSNLAGFGDYVLKTMERPEENGIYVVDRKNKDYFASADELMQKLYRFVQLGRRERINQRNRVESVSHMFDWKEMIRYYEKLYDELV